MAPLNSPPACVSITPHQRAPHSPLSDNFDDRHLPRSLAKHGEVKISGNEIAKLMG